MLMPAAPAAGFVAGMGIRKALYRSYKSSDRRNRAPDLSEALSYQQRADSPAWRERLISPRY